MSGVIDIDGTRAEWTFPAEANAVRAARHVVRDTLRTWGLDPGVRDVTVLLVSELVTNSLRYASGPIGVRLIHREPTESAPFLLVEVSDPLPDPPTERAASPDDEGGRGLQLVARSTRRWGTRRDTGGKTVWFELALTG
ncbi:ATP-binding protein [Streptomyces albipurpureus]|uniref:ATP-binding protein n=1 Tax=Streptomyces albipurpureus TaxID=2897419 RepID=A0ABT0ULY7_9ACTN|nr:ATP-binding protein [Streptomyces sp. CWNU-1]MCM2389120.1 ATP-binding protein [Streptomyces sp. CWNU-1]